MRTECHNGQHELNAGSMPITVIATIIISLSVNEQLCDCEFPMATWGHRGVLTSPFLGGQEQHLHVLREASQLYPHRVVASVGAMRTGTGQELTPTYQTVGCHGKRRKVSPRKTWSRFHLPCLLSVECGPIILPL